MNDLPAVRVLSLDLASTFGWALGNHDGKRGVITHSGEIDLSRKDTHPGHRFLKFNEFLHKFTGVKEILYEDVPRFESAGAARVYCGLLAHLQVFCLAQNIRLTNMKPGSIKKHFTGHGNAKKEVMCEVAHRLGWGGGHKGTDMAHNECDAIALMWVVFTIRGLDPKFA